ncbi:MAG: chemotaxis protein CheR [Verrucomicrobia bacterium]|nr:chemotaxis protein CheR [Verrucomicrobiota bacterium]
MSAAIASTVLAQLTELLSARTGLHFPPERWPDLQRGISSAAREFGFADAEACAQWLLSAPLDREQIEVLASCLTVGETSFFREGRMFEALEQHILPELIAARRGREQRLRLWSAGCCTGEEPYSLAVLLSRLLPDLAEWQVTLLATDINPRFLQKAADGVYGEWSFRDVPEWLKEHYFTRTTDKRWAIAPRIKRMVTFACLNLAEDAYPSLATNTNAMDLIICRNVLMYFTPAQARRVARHLCNALVEGGWLIASPTEAPHMALPELEAVQFPGAFVYRKPLPGEMRQPCEAIQAPKWRELPSSRSLVAEATPGELGSSPHLGAPRKTEPLRLGETTGKPVAFVAPMARQIQMPQPFLPPTVPPPPAPIVEAKPARVAPARTIYEEAQELFEEGRYAEVVERLTGSASPAGMIQLQSADGSPHPGPLPSQARGEGSLSSSLPSTPNDASALPAKEALSLSPRQRGEGRGEGPWQMNHPVSGRLDARALELLARACANQGKLAEALNWCGKAVAADKMNAGFHYLRATILQERGAAAEAVHSLRRALYLDPKFVLAHFALGNLARSHAKAAEAEKHFQHALQLLRGLRADEILPESDGITAGRLAEIIGSMTARRAVA